MKKNSKNLSQEIVDFFKTPPDAEQKTLGVINDFYHKVLTYMDDNKITQSDLAKKLGKSRSSISQLFKKNPNISIKRMVIIADALGITLKIDFPEISIQNTEKAATFELHPIMWESMNIPVHTFEKNKKNTINSNCYSEKVIGTTVEENFFYN